MIITKTAAELSIKTNAGSEAISIKKTTAALSLEELANIVIELEMRIKALEAAK